MVARSQNHSQAGSPDVASERQDLDSALAEVGTDIILRRTIGKIPHQINVDCTVRARVISSNSVQYASKVDEIYSIAIISPTQIMDAQWPGGNSDDSGVDPSLPRNSDSLIIAGRERAILAVDPFYIAGELVRLELRIAG